MSHITGTRVPGRATASVRPVQATTLTCQSSTNPHLDAPRGALDDNCHASVVAQAYINTGRHLASEEAANALSALPAARVKRLIQ